MEQKAVRPSAKLPPNVPALNLIKGLKPVRSRHNPTSPLKPGKTEKGESNFGVSVLSAGN